MESKPSTGPGTENDARPIDDGPALAIDPAADLELLDRAKSAAHVDQFLDFGPWWYAPLLATLVGGLTMYGDAIDNFVWNGVFGLVALAAGATLAFHDYRRRSVRLGPSTKGGLLLGLALVLCWIVIAAWGTAISSLGFERFVPGYAALGWALTTLFFLAVRTALLRLRSQRAPLR